LIAFWLIWVRGKRRSSHELVSWRWRSTKFEIPRVHVEKVLKGKASEMMQNGLTEKVSAQAQKG
jgi:hypothetical protein